MTDIATTIARLREANGSESRPFPVSRSDMLALCAEVERLQRYESAHAEKCAELEASMPALLLKDLDEARAEVERRGEMLGKVIEDHRVLFVDLTEALALLSIKRRADIDDAWVERRDALLSKHAEKP